MSSTYAMCARARAEICLCASTGGPRVVRVGLQLGYDDLELLNPLGVLHTCTTCVTHCVTHG